MNCLFCLKLYSKIISVKSKPVYKSQFCKPQRYFFPFLTCYRSDCSKIIWATAWQNQQNYFCTQQRLRSAWHLQVWSVSWLCAQWIAKDPSFLHTDSENSDQTGWMPRLIRVFARHTRHFVGFVMLQLISMRTDHILGCHYYHIFCMFLNFHSGESLSSYLICFYLINIWSSLKFVLF